MWNYLKIDPIEPYVDYFATPGNVGFQKKAKLNAIWKKYVVTENGRISIFANMERIKLVYSTIMSYININYFIENEYINKIFALNDDYELRGRSMKLKY